MEVNPKDPIVRYAILEAHGFKCYYSKLSLNMFTLTIDHIIPQSYDTNIVEFDAYKKILGYDFEINHLYNLVPATWEINKLKGDKLYDIPHAIFLMNRAKEKATAILKRIDELRKYKYFEKSLSMVTAYIGSSDNPRQELSKITELLPEYFGSYDVKREVSERGLSRTEPSVSLTAILPKDFEQLGSCCFEFKSIFASDCMITLSHEQITQQLLVGLNTDYKLKKRRFVIGPHFKLPNVYYIQLGNNRFAIEEKEVEELCEIVDDLGQVYTNRFQAIELEWKTLKFKDFNPYEFSVKLFQIKRNLWNKMIEFSWEFDYSNGDSEWHIFNRTSSAIMLYSDGTVLTRLEPEHLEPYLNTTHLNIEDMIWIKWKRYDNKYIKSEESWSAEQTFFWMKNIFIPYVIYYYEFIKSKRNWVAMRPSFNEFTESYNCDDFIFNSGVQTQPSFEEINNVEDLLSEMYSLQKFFNLNSSVTLSSEETRNVYLGIKYILMSIDVPDYSNYYIKKQINHSMHDKFENDALVLINHKLETTDLSDTTSYHIEGLFKCYIEALKCEDALRSLKKTVITEIIKLLKPVWRKYQLIKYIQRISKENNYN
ncbi:hypothetical protein J2W91_001878 [Paenibacillus amylolyticus]|uniref:Uncharacterized protein n=1 Tax=Paenibacillus amylolyticus TaxID=1451 RepID=A0AAP5LLT4_PAEAM|nr:hypothetical protein [Paenibacillus amylolyticus]MDR6723426.1 hypothetical protein [Paenibacillus amylolyticus]